MATPTQQLLHVTVPLMPAMRRISSPTFVNKLSFSEIFQNNILIIGGDVNADKKHRRKKKKKKRK